MIAGSLVRLATQSLRRHSRTYVLSAVGVVAGIAAFVFFVALTGGVREVVLGRIFPVDRLEVVPRTFDVGPLQLGGVGSSLAAKMDDGAVRRLGAIPGVAAAFPKQRLAFKAMGWMGGDLFGRDLRFEVFGDGIDPALLVREPEAQALFAAASVREEEEGPPCNPKQKGSCPEDRTCLADTRRCARPIPVVVSAHLLEMYNGSAVRAFGVPRVSPETLVGITGTLQFGRSFAGREPGKPVLRRKARIVGISDKAILFGATMPIEYVRRYNAIYRGDEGAREYDSAVLQLRSAEDVGPVIAAAEDLGFDLDERSEDARRAGLLITIMALALTLISLAVVGIAAIHVAHAFFMVVLERRREIGLLRAVGAASVDVRRLVLLESSAVGLLSGVAGVVLARGAALALDLAAGHLLPDFPYRPETYFAFPPWLYAAGVGFAIVFCVGGAWLPASRAARVEPARALM